MIINHWWLLGGLLVLFCIALLLALYPLRKSKVHVVMLVPVIFCSVAFAYWRWGAWPEWKQYVQHQVRQQQAEAMLQSIRSPEELIAKLKARLKQQPRSAKGWYLLGRLYANQGQWQHARDAFAKAYQLNPNDEPITVNYAQSLWQLNDRQFDEEIRGLFQSVLKRNENQPDALAMLAMDAFIGHSYEQAINYWEQLLKIAPPQSEDAIAIRKAIAKAQRLTKRLAKKT